MKFLSAFFAIFILSGASAASYAHSINLTIDNIKKIKGVMMIALYDSSENYKSNNGARAAKKIPVNDKKMVVDFTDIPAGDYAIKLYQDENDNGKIDKDTFGIPSEGYGFSNNGGSFGQPSFSEAKFTVKGDTALTIHLH